MEYTLIFSKRKTLGISIKNGEIVVRAPRGMRRSRVEYYIQKHRSWIDKHLEKEERDRAMNEALTPSQISQMKKAAKEYFVTKTAEISKNMHLEYGRVTITSARKRFGSCSSKGNICFSYRLMMYPEAAREYVVVHELAHLVHMDHSPEFYRLIEQYMPDYKERKKLLG